MYTVKWLVTMNTELETEWVTCKISGEAKKPDQLFWCDVVVQNTPFWASIYQTAQLEQTYTCFRDISVC